MHPIARFAHRSNDVLQSVHLHFVSHDQILCHPPQKQFCFVLFPVFSLLKLFDGWSHDLTLVATCTTCSIRILLSFSPLLFLLLCWCIVWTGRHRWSGCIPMSVSACLSVCFSFELLIFFLLSRPLDAAHWAEGEQINTKEKSCNAAFIVDVLLIYKWDHRDWTITKHTPTDIHHSHKQ